jgi:hypothetical protein
MTPGGGDSGGAIKNMLDGLETTIFAKTKIDTKIFA